MTKLEDLKGNSAVLTMHARAVDLLRQIGFFEFMEEQGRPQIIGLGGDVQQMATQAARSAGYFDALEDLIHFKERYFSEEKSIDSVVPRDYGGLSESVRQGYLTKEEADGLRTEFLAPK